MKCYACGQLVRAFYGTHGQELIVNYSKVTYNGGAPEIVNDDGTTNHHPKDGDRGYVPHACFEALHPQAPVHLGVSPGRERGLNA